MRIVYPPSTALLIGGVLLAHENGHYYSALARRGDPDLPIMIPTVIGAIGITRVRNLPELSPSDKQPIIAAGPIAGFITALALFPLAIVFGGKAMLLSLAGITALEMYNGILGSDGKKLKKERLNVMA
jgi:membrane-associated protease RseP (regulator of RpoE activity)